MSVTPCCLRKRFTSFQLNFSLAALRLMARPAPCDAESSESGFPFPLTTNPGDAIEPGMIPKYTLACRRRAFAMHDDFPFHAINDMFLFPREVVMVLQIEQHLRAEIFRDVPMKARMVRRCVAAHQLHRVPVFLAFLRIERKPCQPEQITRQRGTT